MNRSRLPQEIIDQILFYLAPEQLYGDPCGSRRSILNAATISEESYSEAERILRRDVVVTILRNGTFVFGKELVPDRVRSWTLEIQPWSTWGASSLGLLGSFEALFIQELQWFREHQQPTTDSYKDVDWMTRDGIDLAYFMPVMESPSSEYQRFLQRYSLKSFLDTAIESCCRRARVLPESITLNAIGCWTNGAESSLLALVADDERDDIVKIGRELSQAIAHHVLRKYLSAESPDCEAIKFSQFPVTGARCRTFEGLMPIYLSKSPTGLKRLHVEFCFQDYRDASKRVYRATMKKCRAALLAITYPICLQLTLMNSPETPNSRPYLLDYLFDDFKPNLLKELALQGWYLTMSTLRSIVDVSHLSRLSLEGVTFFAATESAAMDSLCLAKRYSENQDISINLVEVSTCMHNGRFRAAPSRLSIDAIHFIKETISSAPRQEWARRRYEYVQRFPIAIRKGKSPVATSAWYGNLQSIWKRTVATCPDCLRNHFPSLEALVNHFRIDHGYKLNMEELSTYAAAF
ncbi:hypothetical protein EV356DRAFT_501382 [Viridothelium virens]|uniref:Uncharacterized protein n=1 Tax=Viridothelium virens TaxID=1048519 RepID=A0A6A6HBD7_VIRVR|nr:hypothetical protein EV356DRAFT_501382 [Viridothelium virens]